MAAALQLDPAELPGQGPAQPLVPAARTVADEVADRVTERLLRELAPLLADRVRAAVQEEGETLGAA